MLSLLSSQISMLRYLIYIDVIASRISQAEHLPTIWPLERFLCNLYPQDLFQPCEYALQIAHFQLEMNRSIFRERIFLAQQHDHSAAGTELQSAVMNPFIPTVERLQSKRILIKRLAGFIMSCVHI